VSPKEPKVNTDKGYTPLGEHNPCDYSNTYVDGDMDDYSKSETLDPKDDNAVY